MLVTFKAHGIGVKFVTGTDPEDFKKAIDEKTKAIYIESISNPAYHVSDIPALAKVQFYLSLTSLYKLTSYRLPMITTSPSSSITHSEWEVELHTFLTSPFLTLRQDTSSSRSSLVQISLARPPFLTLPLIL